MNQANKKVNVVIKPFSQTDTNHNEKIDRKVMIEDRVGRSRLDHQDKRVIKEILVQRGQKEIPVFENKKVILVLRVHKVHKVQRVILPSGSSSVGLSTALLLDESQVMIGNLDMKVIRRLTSLTQQMRHTVPTNGMLIQKQYFEN